MTGLVSMPLYLLVADFVSELRDGLFIAVIGMLLVATGILRLASESVALEGHDEPTYRDAVIVGAFQRLSIFPGFRDPALRRVFCFSPILGAVGVRFGLGGLTIGGVGLRC